MIFKFGKFKSTISVLLASVTLLTCGLPMRVKAIGFFLNDDFEFQSELGGAKNFAFDVSFEDYPHSVVVEEEILNTSINTTQYSYFVVYGETDKNTSAQYFNGVAYPKPQISLTTGVKDEETRVGVTADISLQKKYQIRAVFNAAKRVNNATITDMETGEVIAELPYNNAMSVPKTEKPVKINKIYIAFSGQNKGKLGKVRVYHDPVILEKSSITDKAKNVGIDSGIELDFSKELNADTKSAIRVKAGSKTVETEVSVVNDKAVVTFPNGLEYNTDYKLLISSDLEAKDFTCANDVSISFKTEPAPFIYKLDNGSVDLTNISDVTALEPDVTIHHRYADARDYHLYTIVRDENDSFLKAFVNKMSVKPNEKTVFDELSLDISGIEGRKKAEMYLIDALCENLVEPQEGSDLTYTASASTISDVKPDVGYLDRAFDANKKLYTVILPYGTDTVPEITFTGDATYAKADSIDEISTIKVGDTAYKFRFKVEGARISSTMPDDTTAKITISKSDNSRNMILVFKPQKTGSQESFTYSDFSVNFDSSMLQDVIIADGSVENINYDFSSVKSGMYTFYTSKSESSNYFASQNDIDGAVATLKKLKEEDAPDTEFIDFVEDYGLILKLDVKKFKNLSDKTAIISGFKNNDVSGADKILAEFNKALPVAEYNSAVDKLSVAKIYKTKFGISTDAFDTVLDSSEWTDVVNSRLQNKETYADICSDVSEQCALIVIDKSAPSDITGNLELYAETLSFTEREKLSYIEPYIAEVIKTLKDKELSTVKILKDYIEAAIKAVENEKTEFEDSDDEENVGSLGGTGGKKDKVKGSYTMPIIPETPNDEPKEEPKHEMRFTDVTSAHSWAENAITYLSENGILNGRGNNRFCPDDAITREEFVKLLVVAFDLKAEGKLEFTDANADAWYASYLITAKNIGIVSGKPDGSFGIGEKITRQDMAVMTINAMKLANRTVVAKRDYEQFVDEVNFAGYSKDKIIELYRAGIVNGVGGNSYSPYGTCTRAMAAQIIYNALMH